MIVGNQSALLACCWPDKILKRTTKDFHGVYQGRKEFHCTQYSKVQLIHRMIRHGNRLVSGQKVIFTGMATERRKENILTKHIKAYLPTWKYRRFLFNIFCSILPQLSSDIEHSFGIISNMSSVKQGGGIKSVPCNNQHYRHSTQNQLLLAYNLDHLFLSFTIIVLSSYLAFETK